MACSTLCRLTVEYQTISGSIKRLQPNRGKAIQVHFPLNETVNNFIKHLGHSFNSLHSQTSAGKELYLIRRKVHTRLDEKKGFSLVQFSVQDGDHFVLLGYKPISRIKFTIVVKGPGDNRMEFDVLNTTTIDTLKHRIQNRTGIHESEIVLMYKGKVVPKGSRKTVEFYDGRSGNKAQLEVNQRSIARESEENVSVPNEEPSELDGPYHNRRNTQSATGAFVREQTVMRNTRRSCRSRQGAPQYPQVGSLVCAEDQVHETDQDMLARVPNNAPISEAGLLDISEEMTGWKHLAIRLGLNESERVVIEEDNRHDFAEQKLQMLKKWKRKNGREATWKKLLCGVLKEKDRELAWKIISHAQKRKDSDSVQCAQDVASPQALVVSISNEGAPVQETQTE